MTVSTLTTMANSKSLMTMKKMFRNLMLVAVAAMGLASCQNESIQEITRPQEVAMTIIAEADDTRTVIDEANNRVNWSDGDALKVIENSATYRTTTAINIDGNGKAQFTVAFPANTSDASFTYNAIYPASAVVEDDAEKVDAAKVKVIVKDQQMPTATSFDPAADILVSKHIETEAQPTELNMQFKRLVALGKMTLNNLPDEAAIEKVIFTAGTDDVVAGRNYVNATTGEVSQYGYHGKTNVLTISYDEPIDTRDIYFACNPFEMEAGETFTVKVVCNDATYTRQVTIPEGRSLSFKEGDLNTFKVDMTNAIKESNFAFAEGNYVVIAKNGSKYYAMKGVKGSGNFMTYSEVSYDGTATTFATDDETLVWTIAAADGGFTLQNNEGKYLYGSNSGNYAYLGNAQTLTITPVEDTTQQYNIGIKSISDRILAFNTNSGQERFAFYKGTMAKNLYLVPVVENNAPYFTVTPTEFTFSADGGEEAEFEIIAMNGFNAEVTATTDAEWLTLSSDDNIVYAVAAMNEGAARNATITFTAGELSAVVAITQKEKVSAEESTGGRDDFNTVSANSSYSSRTTTAGWKGANCAVMQGGTSDNNPTFKFIGSTDTTRAFTINGKTSAKGTITSPTLTNGCGKLSLKYGHAFSESNGVDFNIIIKQNGSAVQTYRVDVNSITQKTVYTWEQDVNVAGDFVIEITNNSPSNNSSSNKDRVSIWDIEWTGYAE